MAAKYVLFGLIVFAFGLSPAHAQENPPQAEALPESTKPWALTLTLDVPTAYFFRGYNQEDSGCILQPAVTFSYTVFSSEDLSITPYVTTWNSIHETKSPQSPKHWFESDVIGGTKFAYRQFTLDVYYTHYIYPGSIAGDIDEIGATLSYDDSDWATSCNLPFSFQPYVSYWREVSDENGDQDTSMEVGIKPAFDIPDTQFTVVIPVAVGLSPDGFYLDSSGNNEAFGYASIGAIVSHPLPIPEQYGKWTISAGVQYLYLEADSLRTVNNGTHNQFIGKLSVAAEF